MKKMLIQFIEFFLGGGGGGGVGGYFLQFEINKINEKEIGSKDCHPFFVVIT